MFIEAVACNAAYKWLLDHSYCAVTVTVNMAIQYIFYLLVWCQCGRAYSGRVCLEQEPFQSADTSASAARQSLQSWQGHNGEPTQQCTHQRILERRASRCLMPRLSQPYWAAAWLPPHCAISSSLILDEPISLKGPLINLGAFHLHHSCCSLTSGTL